MPRKQRPVRWIDVMVSNVGLRNAGRVLSFIATWAITEPTEGDQLDIRDYGKQWGLSQATAYRDLALFREALPMFKDPSAYLAVVGRPEVMGSVPAELLPQL